jgi:hypothetical protein
VANGVPGAVVVLAPEDTQADGVASELTGVGETVGPAAPAAEVLAAGEGVVEGKAAGEAVGVAGPGVTADVDGGRWPVRPGT